MPNLMSRRGFIASVVVAMGVNLLPKKPTVVGRHYTALYMDDPMTATEIMQRRMIGKHRALGQSYGMSAKRFNDIKYQFSKTALPYENFL